MLRRDGEVFFFGTAMVDSSEDFGEGCAEVAAT
jgi:hypothetical protein